MGIRDKPTAPASPWHRLADRIDPAFRRRKDGEEWALEMERNGSSKPRALRTVRTFGDLIDLHDLDMREVGKPCVYRKPKPERT